MELPLVINTKALDTLVVFAPKEDRLYQGEYLIAKPEDLEALPKSLLCRIYNEAHPDVQPVDAFKPGTEIRFCLPSLKKLAESQVIKKNESVDEPSKEVAAPIIKEDTVSQEAPKPSETAEKPVKEKKPRGSRATEFLGKTIVPKVTENPRREGTKGHKSMQIILDHHKAHGYKGILFTKFVELGGRAEDLAWDLAKGSVEVK